MMFSGLKGSKVFNILEGKWRGDSSLSAGLLNDVPPEIELSGYQRAPSPGSESPSGLLNGESLKVEPIADLDLFFERLYSYYCEKGFWVIITKRIVELLILVFIIFLSVFVFLFVDWNGLRNAKCGMDAVESGIKPCDLVKEALHQHPLTPLTLWKAVIMGYLGMASIYWIFCFLRFFAQIKDMVEMRQFYHSSLHVADSEIQNMPWASILEKVVQIQSTQQLCVVKDLSAHDVVMRLMRKENYLIAMLNKGLLSFPISQWVPGAGPTVRFGRNGKQHCPILPKTLEWTLNWCILQSMFDRNFRIRRDFIADPETLKKRLMVVGFAMFLLSPFLVVFMVVYLFLRHAEEFRKNPSRASSRRWSNLSKWMFREFNEVDCLFEHRINCSAPLANDYLKQFPSPIISIIAKFISFVSGGFAAILIIIAFLDESLLEAHIFGRNLFWYTAVFGTITALSRLAVSDELLVLDPQGTMSLVVRHTHYMPKKWRGKENTEFVRVEFETLFQNSVKMALEEMASIFLTPYLLLFVVPQRVDEILQFIADFTMDVEGVGHVCSFSLFDFQHHGNSKYGSPHDSSRMYRSSQGKMEKSFLSFQSSYPSWEPNAQGKQLLATLVTFREQMIRGQGLRPAYMTPGMQQWTPSRRGQGELHSYFSREPAHDISRNGYHLGAMLLIDYDQKNFPYIIDWYYTSVHYHPTVYPRDIESAPVEDDAEERESPRDVWDPPNLGRNYQTPYNENWGNFLEDRSRSHLEASTSIPLLPGSVIHHHDPDPGNAGHHQGRSHWWARGGPQGAEPHASFLEPPSFNHNVTYNYHDHFSERSSEEEHEHQLDRRGGLNRLSRAFYMDDFEGGGEFKLPFDDIYSRHSNSPPRPDF